MQLNKIFKDSDVKVNLLNKKTIGIIGYGNQGSAQALNLKDSNIDVIIGLRSNSKSIELAKSDNFKVFEVSKTIELSDVVCLLVPDEEIESIFNNKIKSFLKKGQSLLFAHGYSVFFKKITIPDFVNVLLVAPSGSGKMVREEFINGKGVPNLIAIDQDYTGDSLDLALSYSKAIGGTRLGAFLSTFKEEVVTDIFGEQVVLTGGIPSIIKESFNVLLEAGYSPIVAWFVCYYEAKSIVDTFHQNGFNSFNKMISNIAEYGGLTRGKKLIDHKVKDKMRKILSDIENGKFEAEWTLEKKTGFNLLNQKRDETKNSEIEKITLQMLSILKK